MNLLECLEIFVEQEKKAAYVYELIEYKSEGEISKIASKFKHQEQTHIKTLKQLTESILGKDIIINDNLKEIVESHKDNVSVINVLSFENRKELFLYALQNEKDSIYQYEQFQRSFNTNEEISFVFETLLKGENQHMYVILEILHDLK